MHPGYEMALAHLRPYITEAAGVNIFTYPGTRDDFSRDLANLGMEGCLIRFALKFEGRMIDLDLLFHLVDIVRTTDGAVIFYNPESRVLDLKMITRPTGGS